MERAVAERIIKAAKQSDVVLHEMHLAIDSIHDQEEKKKYKKAWAMIVSQIYETVTREVVKGFPDLHPDRGV
jgi:hypothetical protein